MGYCGYVMNQESGLYTVRFRHYEPVWGRWIERDPIGYADSMSLYGYGWGDPMTLLDPFGLQSSLTHPKSVVLQMVLALEAQGLTTFQIAWRLAAAGVAAALIAEVLDVSLEYAQDVVQSYQYDRDRRNYLNAIEELKRLQEEAAKAVGKNEEGTFGTGQET